MSGPYIASFVGWSLRSKYRCFAKLSSVVCSVDPGDGHPLRRAAHARERGLERGERVVDVGVDDVEVEVVPVRAPQLLRLADQQLQRAVVLGEGVVLHDHIVLVRWGLWRIKQYGR